MATFRITVPLTESAAKVALARLPIAVTIDSSEFDLEERLTDLEFTVSDDDYSQSTPDMIRLGAALDAIGLGNRG